MAATASRAEWRPRSSWVQTLETIFCFFQVIRKELSISILLRSGIHFGSTAILTVHSQTLNLNFNYHLKVTSLSLASLPSTQLWSHSVLPWRNGLTHCPYLSSGTHTELVPGYSVFPNYLHITAAEHLTGGPPIHTAYLETSAQL